MIIDDIQLTENFKLSEFKCKDGSEFIKINMEIVQKLQELRDLIKKPIIITSGYRSPTYNKSIGGAENSEHVKGNAVDIYVEMDLKKLYYLCDMIFDGVGIYDGHIHVDVRGQKANWDNRTKQKGVFI